MESLRLEDDLPLVAIMLQRLFDYDCCSMVYWRCDSSFNPCEPRYRYLISLAVILRYIYSRRITKGKTDVLQNGDSSRWITVYWYILNFLSFVIPRIISPLPLSTQSIIGIQIFVILSEPIVCRALDGASFKKMNYCLEMFHSLVLIIHRYSPFTSTNNYCGLTC